MRWLILLLAVGCSAPPPIGRDPSPVDTTARPPLARPAAPTLGLCPQGCPAPAVCWQEHAEVPDSSIGDLYGRCTTSCIGDSEYTAECATLGGHCAYPVVSDGGPDLEGQICEHN